MKAMITVVTLYRGESSETYVGIVSGSLGPEERKAVADGLDVDREAGDDIGFVEMAAAPSAGDLKTLANAFGDARTTLEQEAG